MRFAHLRVQSLRWIATSTCGHKRSSSKSLESGRWCGSATVQLGAAAARSPSVLAPNALMHYDLGYIDLEQKTLQPLDNPFGPRLLPMS